MGALIFENDLKERVPDDPVCAGKGGGNKVITSVTTKGGFPLVFSSIGGRFWQINGPVQGHLVDGQQGQDTGHTELVLILGRQVEHFAPG